MAFGSKLLVIYKYTAVLLVYEYGLLFFKAVEKGTIESWLRHPTGMRKGGELSSISRDFLLLTFSRGFRSDLSSRVFYVAFFSSAGF